MFDFIRKQFVWDAWDAGLQKEIGETGFHLKTAQDLGVYKELRGIKGKKIAEIGGGDSRLLQRLAGDNECYNIEKFEGADGGPADEIKIDNVENIKVFLGEHSPDIAPETFDVVFSISVVEHIPSPMLSPFFEDGMRILKPGGLWLHAIDMYIEDTPTHDRVKRFEEYRKWANDARLQPIGTVYQGPLKFSTEMVTNPDHTMYNWGKIAPALNDLRKRAQSVSIITAGRKKS